MSIPQLHSSGQYAVEKYRSSNGTVIIGQNMEYDITARNGGSSNVSWGSHVQFYFNNIADAIATDTSLRIQMAVPTVVGGSPTAIAYVNAVGIFMFTKIRFMCSGRSICTDVDPQLFRNWLQLVVPIDEWPIVAKQCGIDTAANRQAAVVAGVQTFYFPVHWLFRYLQQLPLNLIAPNEVSLEFWLAPGATSVVTYTAGTTPVVTANINQMDLRVGTELSPAVAKYIRDISGSGVSVNAYGLSSGLLFEGNDFLSQYYTSNSGDTTAQLQIPSMSDKLVKAVIITTQLASDLNAGQAVSYDSYTNVISSFNIKNGSAYVDGTDSIPITQDMLARDYARNHIPGVYQLGYGSNTLTTTNALFRVFCNNLDQDSFDEGMPGFSGAYDYFGIANPYIQLNYASALGAATTVSVHVIYARRDVLNFKTGLFDELQSLVRKPGY